MVQYFRNPRDRSRRALLAGGGGLTPDYEYQTLKKAYGKFTLEVDLQGLGGVVSDPFDWSAGSPSAATLQTALNTMLGSGRAEVTDGAVYRIKFVGDLAEYDLPQLTLTADNSYPLNDGSGTAPTKTSQRDYVAPVAGVKENVTLSLTPTDSGQVGSVADTNGNAITYDGVSNYSTTAAFGWAANSGSGTSTVTFECDTFGPHSTSLASTTNNSAGSPVTVNTAGVAAVTEVFGQVVATEGGAAGWYLYTSTSPSFTVAIPLTADNAAALAILNASGAYNGTVESVSITSGGLEVNFTATNNPGTVTIGGVVGAAVTSAVDTLQDGANALPSGLPTPVLAISFASPYVFQTVGGAAAVSDGDPIGSALGTPPTTNNGSQSTSGSRPSFIAAGGASFDGSGDRIDVGTAGYAEATEATITAFAQTNSGAGNYCIFGSGDTSGTANRFLIFLASNAVTVQRISSAGVGSAFTTTATFNWTTPHHVAVAVSAGAAAIYVDGVSQAGSYTDGSAAGMGFLGANSGSKLTSIGARRSNGSYGLSFPGVIKDVRVYSVALSAEEVASVMAGEF
jgi:hypothetical protein